MIFPRPKHRAWPFWIFLQPGAVPCQMLAPVLHELADEVGSKAAFYSIDVDENRQLATEYGISSIPCLVVLKNGQESARSVGFLPKQALQDMLDKYI